ncbi:putative leucine-rich repeat-containing, plant-type, leucine-rich repeat domain superfamily [Helianthus annuus]|nr:putative leucine-rich repeat-containing, plant-type, leucine-rich repeat domain superfamily [Helianthus annuus]
MSNSILLFFFLSLFFISSTSSSSSSINTTHKCSVQQTLALLLFKQNLSSILFKQNLSSINDTQYRFLCEDSLGSSYSPIIKNWNTSTDCCDWNGVTCDHSTGDVISLDMSCGMVQGTIHPNSTLFHLPRLQRLNLAFNNFSYSQLPPAIGRLSNSLTHLNISSCGFTGQVPTDVSYLHKLVSLDLSSNGFTGQVPTDISHLHKLVSLDLSSNGFTGQVPTDISHLHKLVSLDLSSNGFTGQVPTDISHLHKLVSLDLSMNKDDFNLEPYVFINLLRNLTVMKELSLTYVNISAVLPSNLNISSALKLLNLGSTGLQGKLPRSIFTLQSLETLDLSFNSFTGHIPSEVSLLPNLISLHLSGNAIDLEPHIFSSLLVNSTFLRDLWLHEVNIGTSLSGEIPASISHLKSLFYLDLSDCGLNGSLPKSLGQLPTEYLQNFNAMKNVVKKNTKPEYVSTDSIYYSIIVTVKGVDQYFPQLSVEYTIVDLSGNKFEGEIPNIIGNLKSLIALNLSHNSLTSQIPHSLGNISEIESLDLSWNQLTGEIPQSLADLTNLEVLKLSQNHLVGHIPQGKQFDTFDNYSFGGNPKLCGLPLTKKCSEHPHVLQLEGDGDEEESGFTWKVVMLGYGCGVLPGIVLGYIMLSTGRPKWFNAIADAADYMTLKR